MPKMKTDRGAAKRVKVTGTGRLRRRSRTAPTCSSTSPAPRKRRLGREEDFSRGDERRAKRMLGL